MATILKKCECGVYKKHGGWTKPDKTQLNMISMFVNSGKAEIVKEPCPDCQSKEHERKVSLK